MVIDFLKNKLRNNGYRITKAREKILDFFLTVNRSVSVYDLHQELKKIGLEIDISTIYRQIAPLIKEKIIEHAYIDKGVEYYDLYSAGHTYHVICMKCKKTLHIVAKYCQTSDNKVIENKTKYKILDSDLKFFGLCETCQNS